MRRPKKFERNTAGTHRPDHRSHFKRRLVILQHDLKIKDIVHMHQAWLSMMHPPIEMSKTVPSPLTLPPEKGQKQAHGNTQMFSPIKHLRRITASQSGGLETEAARLTMKRGNTGNDCKRSISVEQREQKTLSWPHCGHVKGWIILNDRRMLAPLSPNTRYSAGRRSRST
ncbi:MAG: hypothetical protein IPO99_20260 [Nitrospira sp.]|nr:hypothetical protein [Nitrospira sp.]